MRNDIDLCQWCGRNGADDTHHLFRRSTNPGLLTDPNNLVRLCRTCHGYATTVKEVEEMFQRHFFAKPEQETLSIEYIRDVMQNEAIISPRDLSRFRIYLASQYSYLTATFNKLEAERPFMIEEFRKQEDVKSDTRAERLYEMTKPGIEHKTVKHNLKAIEKMLSALRTAHEQVVREGFSIM